MSASLPSHLIPEYQGLAFGDGFKDVPSGLDLALNGDTNDFKSLKIAESSLLDPESFCRLSTSTIGGLTDDDRIGRSASASHNRLASRSPAPPRTLKGKFDTFWQRNRGVSLVALSQFFAALMNVTTRLLELEGEGMSPFQILFVRMGITSLGCIFWMWYTEVPDFPFGMKGTRRLLVSRAFFGFFGIFGMYYSLQYLPLADATVITFLAPAVAGFACYVLIGEQFTRIEKIASVISFVGVVLIARPTSFMDFSAPSITSEPLPYNATEVVPTAVDDQGIELPTPTNGQRLAAIGMALLGVIGSAGALTSIRWIGRRAHPLISVNYFAVWCTLISMIALSVGPYLPGPFNSPDMHFVLPRDLRQWGLLILLGACGFIFQFMLTAGMSHEKSNRATSMVYTNMLFALLFDRWVFGTIPGWWSLIGSSLILGSAIYVALQRGSGERPVVSTARARTGYEAVLDEEIGMLQNTATSRGIEDENDRPHLRTDIELEDINSVATR